MHCRYDWSKSLSYILARNNQFDRTVWWRYGGPRSTTGAVICLIMDRILIGSKGLKINISRLEHETHFESREINFNLFSSLNGQSDPKRKYAGAL